MNKLTIPDQLTVDWLLNNVDLEFKNYIPSQVAFEFFNFIRLSLGEEPENSNPLAHYFLIDTIFQQDSVKFYYEARGIDYDELKGSTAIMCCREFSKALALDEKILTPSGWVTMRDIQVGNIVYDRDGKETRVRSKSKVFLKPTYKMVLADGRELVMSEDHENIIWKKTNKRVGGRGVPMIRAYKEHVMTAKEIYEDGLFWDRVQTDKHKKSTENKYFIPRMTTPVDRPESDFPLDAYTVGLILGDGNISKDTGFSRVTTHNEDFEHIARHIPYEIGTVNKSKDNISFFSIKGIGPLVKQWVSTDNVYSKKVPQLLKEGSAKQRLDILQGLMDTDGTINKKGSPSFSTASKQLALDVQELVWSLGGSATIKEYTSNSQFGKYWTVNIKINECLFRLPQKAERQTYIPARDSVAIVDMELVHTRPTQCITVESETKSFITSNYIVTHNSTLIGTYLPLFMAWKGQIPGYGKVNYGLYIGDSMRNNVKTTMNTIETVFLESEWLMDQFESYRFTDEVMELVRPPITKKEIAVYNRAMDMGKKKEQVPGRSKRTFTMNGVGAQTGTRGTRAGLQRPQFAIFDDLISSESDATSKTILENIETTIDSDVLEALHGAGSFTMIIGTPYNKNDPVYKRVESGAWVPIVFPICENISLDLDRKEFKGVWPDRHSYDNVMRRYKKAVRQQKLRAFNQELMLRISSEEDRMIKEADINWFNRGDVLRNISQYNLYITTDFTTTGGEKSDFSGAAIWAINSNADYMLLDIVLKKQDLKLQYENLFKLVTRYSKRTNFIEVGVETDGQQKAHIFALKEMMVKRNEYFSIARQKGKNTEGILSRSVQGTKHDRFKLMHPQFQGGKIWFANELKHTPDMIELLEELMYVTFGGFGSKHDDGCDLISQLALMEISVPSASRDTSSQNEHDPLWDEIDEDEANGHLKSYIV